MPKSCSMVLATRLGPPLNAALTLSVLPVSAMGTSRSRGMDTSETRRVPGSTRTTKVTSLRWPVTLP